MRFKTRKCDKSNHALLSFSCCHVRLSATLWTAACQSPLSMGFPHKNNGVGSHFLLQGIFSNPGIKPVSPALADRFFTTEPPGKPMVS